MAQEIGAGSAFSPHVTTVTYLTPLRDRLLGSSRESRLDNTTHHASVGLIVLVPEVSSAKTVQFTLDELYRHAAAAVIGEVYGVISAGGNRYADIHVRDVLKGDADPIIRVIAESQWRDASSTLEAGMRVLLFLGKRDAARASALPISPMPRGYVPFAGRDPVRLLGAKVHVPTAIAEDVRRHDLQAVLTNEVFAQYLATLDRAS